MKHLITYSQPLFILDNKGNNLSFQSHILAGANWRMVDFKFT